MVRELVDGGCAAPQLNVVVEDPDDGRPLAVAEAYWPEGLQPGQDDPVVLELDQDESDITGLEELGWDVFTSVEALSHAVARRAEVAASLVAAG